MAFAVAMEKFQFSPARHVAIERKVDWSRVGVVKRELGNVGCDSEHAISSTSATVSARVVITTAWISPRANVMEMTRLTPQLPPGL